MITSVNKVMTKKLIVIAMGSSLFEAYQLMKEKRIRHLPVTDANENIVGILSQRDLQYVPDSKNIPVELMMSSPVHFVAENTSLRVAVFQMLQNKISCLLVTDTNDFAVGIVTTDDLLWFLSHLLADENEEDFSVFKFKTKQTIGEVAREISEMGI